jgi:hypothetical protein
MKVKELKKALAGVSADLEVAMADEMSVVFAEVVDGAFILSDMTEGMDEPVEYWRADD